MACGKQDKIEVEEVNVDGTGELRKTFNSLYEMQQAKQFTDVLIVAKENGVKVPVHRNVLSARSEYFRAMFSSEMRESTQSEIRLSEVSGDDLKNLIKYMYTGKIELSDDNIETLMTTAHHYQLTDVVSVCNKFVQRKLDVSNCLGFWAIAELHGSTNLMAAAKAYACLHFTAVCKSEEFLKLDDKQLRKLLASDELCVSKEDTVFESIIEWLQNKIVERKKYICELLPLVRVASLSSTFIADQKKSTLKKINDQELNKEIITWYLTADEQLVSNQRKSVGLSVPEVEAAQELLAVKTVSVEGRIPIYKYTPESEEWTMWRTIVHGSTDFGVTISQNTLVIAGGKLRNRENEVVNTVISLNTKTLSFKTIHPMRTCRQFVSLVVLGQYIYAIGGNDGYKWLKSVERLHRRSGQWNGVPSMLSHINGELAVAVLNGCIFVVGGDRISTECFNPNTHEWRMKSNMNERRDHPGVAVLNGFLYAVGGINSKTVERYDFNADTWTMMCSLNSPREGPGCIALNSRLIVAGGLEQYTFEEYDVIANVWTQKPALPLEGYCTLVLAENISYNDKKIMPIRTLERSISNNRSNRSNILDRL